MADQIKKFNDKAIRYSIVKKAVDYAPDQLTPFVLLCGAVGGFLVLSMIWGLNPFVNLLIFGPLYRSYIGLKNNDVTQDASNISALMIFALVTVLEELVGFVFWIPLYYIFKAGFFVWAFYFGGSLVFFNLVLLPFLVRHDSEIQQAIASGRRVVVDKVEKVVANNAPMVLSHLAALMTTPTTPATPNVPTDA